MVVIVMGVAGSGKTTVGRLLAKRLGLLFRDADDYHPPANLDKLRRGEPLNDDDRDPWIRTLVGKMPEWTARGGAVLACSALRERHRRQLAGQVIWDVRFVHLVGERTLLLGRLEGRADRPFSSEFLDSQFAALEPPADALTFDVTVSPERLCEDIATALGPRSRILLLTGPPGVGKTTVLRRVCHALPHEARPVGFITEEIRRDGRREGFRLVSLDGQEETLAHVDFDTRHRVGKYCVDIRALERTLRRSMVPQGPNSLVVVDEIGKMECCSRNFVDTMDGFIGDGRLVVATVAQRGGGFIARIKRHRLAEVWTVSTANREDLPNRVLAWLDGRLEQSS